MAVGGGGGGGRGEAESTAHTRTHMHTHSECVRTRVSERAGVARIFSCVYTLPAYVRV